MKSIALKQQWSQEVRADRPPSAPEASDSAASPQWLPLLVYRAQYTAELQSSSAAPSSNKPAASASDSSTTGHAGDSNPNCDRQEVSSAAFDILRHQGVPVFCESSITAGCSSQQAEGSHAPNNHYVISRWESQFCPELDAAWSSYYKHSEREPSNLELAPWVAHRYSRRRKATPAAR